MARIPDLTDPRYLDEVGWFLFHAEYRRSVYGGSYDEERLAYSKLFLKEVLRLSGKDESWLRDKTVVTIGCGCTADLVAWPAAAKIAIDPLLYTYQKLGMLMDDAPGTARTLYLSMSAEELPLLDDVADLVLCRNALDHMPDPSCGLAEMRRILNGDGLLFVSVDIGGEPTPDEPTVFSRDSLAALVGESFDVYAQSFEHEPHSEGRDEGARIVARKKPGGSTALDREAVLRAYRARLPGGGYVDAWR